MAIKLIVLLGAYLAGYLWHVLIAFGVWIFVKSVIKTRSVLSAINDILLQAIFLSLIYLGITSEKVSGDTAVAVVVIGAIGFALSTELGVAITKSNLMARLGGKGSKPGNIEKGSTEPATTPDQLKDVQTPASNGVLSNIKAVIKHGLEIKQ